MKKLLSAALTAGLTALQAATITLNVDPEQPVMAADCRQDAMIRIELAAPPPEQTADRAKVNLSIVLDRSGSMQSDNKLQKAREAAIAAVELLSDGDLFALTVYDSEANTLIPSMPVTRSAKADIIRIIKNIRPGGSTALFAGVSLGAHELRKNAQEGYVNRIILLSDGLANVGFSRPEQLGSLGGSLIKEGISVSTIGLGFDYNEDLMTALAQNSDGNFYFVENSRDLPKIFEKELGAALQVAAKDVKLRITCPDDVKLKGILGHDCSIDGNTLTMKFNQLYASQSKVLILQVEVPPQKPDTRLALSSVSTELTALDGTPVRIPEVAAAAEFTTQTEKVEQSLNPAVRADVVVTQSALNKQKALEEADRGNFYGANKIMEDNAEYVLTNVGAMFDAAADNAAAAPAALKLEAEAKLLEQQQIDLEASQDDSEQFNKARKRIRGTNYQFLNSQPVQQSQEHH